MNVIADYIVDSNRIGELSPTHVLLVDKGASVELKGPLRVVVETNFGPAADFKPPYDGKGYFTRFAKIVDIPEGATETVEIIEDTPDTNLGRVSDNMSIAIMLVVP